MKTDITLKSTLERTARVTQIAGLFDYTLEPEQTLTWHHNLPIEEKEWNIGLIVGPSGAGKSVLARDLYGDLVKDGHEWDHRAIIDNFPAETTISEITATLTAVGFGTVPAWLRPYNTLSNGEKFRADMARSIIEANNPIVIDEFTSVVDRQVAKIASNAVAKTVRRANKRFVAVTCHYDILEWLQPDWVYDVAKSEFRWGSVQPRPQLQLEIYPAKRSSWQMFKRHHYMSGELSTAAQCFIAYLDGQPVAFTSYLHFMHPNVKNIKMGHRLVVLPDYQGLGIATQLENWLGDYLWAQGYRYRNNVAHPAMIRLYSKSPRWHDTSSVRKKLIVGPKTKNTKSYLNPRSLILRSFEYTPPKENK